MTWSEYGSNGWVESAPETNEIRFDKRGNLWADGKRVFRYDAFNRLTGVWKRETAPPGQPEPDIEAEGDPIAAFTYDGYGHRLTARYNANDNETLDDDPVDIYSYDHLWRIRTVTEATYHSSTSSWTSFVREQWFYHSGEDPSQYKIGSDAPVMRRIDLNGDGIFEKTQNFVTDRQGSVVAVLGDAQLVDVNNESLGNKPGPMIARVRYDTYGVPTICDPADIDRDGVVDITDVALYCTYWNAWHANGPNTDRYKEILDYNRDGVVDSNDPCTSSNSDYLALTTRAGLVINELVPDVKDVVGNLPLYAGYWWDAQLEMYHVRHRVYRPEWGKWIQRDPLGYAAGWNLYEYVGGEPWREIDPLGLISWGQFFTALKQDIVHALEEVRDLAKKNWDDTINDAKDIAEGFDAARELYGEMTGMQDVLDSAADPDASRDVHDALGEAKNTADQVPGGELTSGALDVVDGLLNIFDAVNGNSPGNASTGPGSGPVGQAIEDTALRLADAASKAEKPQPDSNGKLRNSKGQFASDPDKPVSIPSDNPHGNTVGDQDAYLYGKFDEDGNFEKWGVTKDMDSRYTQKELDGGKLEPVDFGTRRDMIAKERNLVETCPGPANKEPWAGKRVKH